MRIEEYSDITPQHYEEMYANYGVITAQHQQKMHQRNTATVSWILFFNCTVLSYLLGYFSAMEQHIAQSFCPKQFIPPVFLSNEHFQSIFGSGVLLDQIYTLPRNFEVDKETIRTHEGSSVTGDGLDGFFDIEITRENVNGEKTVWGRSNSSDVYGFKEIRYTDPDILKFIVRIFPCA